MNETKWQARERKRRKRLAKDMVVVGRSLKTTVLRAIAKRAQRARRREGR